jgi:D-alanine-D-alanine ligase
MKQKRKIRIAVIFGGKSAEHEVSLQSAKNIINALDRKKYEPVLIGIDKSGKWHVQDYAGKLLLETNLKLKKLNKSESLAVVPARNKKVVHISKDYVREKLIDVVFPVLHGPFGEDGTIQGLFKILDVPFVGPGVLGSAVGMDKDVMKRLFREAGIPTAKFLIFHRADKNKIRFEKIKKELRTPFFVKPTNLGSSVGISKVRNKKDFAKAIKEAFWFDDKIIIEEYIKGREIECSVLGNENPMASVPGEIIPTHEFYSYRAKYIDEDGAILKIPAELSPITIKKVQELAVKVFEVLCCEGMGRVDFFLKSNGKIYANEINTIPGFTKISMYPKLWEASGINCSQLIDKLIELAIKRFEREKKLKTSHN